MLAVVTLGRAVLAFSLKGDITTRIFFFHSYVDSLQSIKFLEVLKRSARGRLVLLALTSIFLWWSGLKYQLSSLVLGTHGQLRHFDNNT